MTLIIGPEAITLIRAACRAEDLFGPCADDEPTERRRIRTYRRLAFVVHPDRAVSVASASPRPRRRRSG